MAWKYYPNKAITQFVLLSFPPWWGYGWTSCIKALSFNQRSTLTLSYTWPDHRLYIIIYLEKCKKQTKTIILLYYIHWVVFQLLNLAMKNTVVLLEETLDELGLMFSLQLFHTLINVPSLIPGTDNYLTAPQLAVKWTYTIIALQKNVSVPGCSVLCFVYELYISQYIIKQNHLFK